MRKIVHAFSDGIKHGWIGRSLPGLFHAAGLTDVTCVPHAVSLYGAFAHHLFDGYLAKAQQAGVLTADELGIKAPRRQCVQQDRQNPQWNQLRPSLGL
jgi:hypothetical protein